MKKKNHFILWIVFSYLLPASMPAQSLSANAFFNSDAPAVYLGIDFTLARLINDDASSARTIQLTQFNGINDLMVSEAKKYDIQEAYHRNSWTVDLKEVEKRNDKADPDSLKMNNDADLTRLSAANIRQLVKNFNFGSHTGYGVLLVMEGMDKTKKLATIWFTLIDMNTKTVLVTDRVEGKLGSGFGFRNYWASAIKNAIKNAKSDYYDKWKSGTSGK